MYLYILFATNVSFLLLGLIRSYLSSPQGNIRVPYVTARQNLWAGARCDVFGTDIDGSTVLPSNATPDIPLYAPLPPAFVEIPVLADPGDYFDDNYCVYLQPGALYRWTNQVIKKPLIIYGRGATVLLEGPGPLLEVYGTNRDSISIDVPCSFYDIHFGGNASVDRLQPMGPEFIQHSAIWFTNAWKSTLSNCTFSNFNGAALFYQDSVQYKPNWQQQHIVSGCRFVTCRIGIANGGGAEYSIASNNCFFDCHVCFNVVGGNWRRTGNNIANCRCAILHVSEKMWYQGFGGTNNPAHGTFTSNTVNHSDAVGVQWPAQFTLSDDKTVVPLTALYFDNPNAMPPTYAANTHWYAGITILNFDQNNALLCFCITGCTLMGNNTNPDQTNGIILSPQVTKRVYFIGCTINNLKFQNVTAANIIPNVTVNSVNAVQADEEDARANEVMQS